MKRWYWSADEVHQLVELYPNMETKRLAEQLGRKVSSVYQKALSLGLRKSAEYLASPAAHRLDGKVGAASRFLKGNVPWNKGAHFKAGGRSQETRFKKGNRPHTWQPIGSERVVGGYLQRKVTDTGYPPRDWKAVHVLMWVERYGPLPPKHCVCFINGDRTDIRMDNLVLLSRRDLMRRNSVHRLPQELHQVIRQKAALQRAINKHTRATA